VNLLTGIALGQGAASAVGLIGLVVNMNRTNKVTRLDTLQRMISELNKLRQTRSDHPELERELFPSRKLWTDERIKEHMAIVQLANTLEWAYLARRDGLIDLEVWESWVTTWKSVISTNANEEHLYDSSVWTFGRSGTIFEDLKTITTGNRTIDPYNSFLDRVATVILGGKRKQTVD
jgi:hypothetical protein